MKNYIVKSLREFDDYEGMPCIPENHKEHRRKGDIFNCTEERYNYLKLNGAVALMGINKVKITVDEKKVEKKVIKATESKKKKSDK